MDGLKYDILDTAIKRFALAKNAERVHHERAAMDLKFATGDHWDEKDRLGRQNNNKPCLTINLLPQSIRAVTGQIRATNPAIRVMAADADAKKDTAEIIEGLIRHIEYQSGATAIYEATCESAAACSMGYWRIGTDYCDDTSFDQDITIERIYNPFSVFLDPSAKDATRKDAQWGFVIEEMPKEAFEEAYPDAATSDFTSAHKDSNYSAWVTDKDTVVVAEYFWIEHDKTVIYQDVQGQVVQSPAVTKGLRKRIVRKPKVMWAKMTATEVLEGPTEFPCRYIPIVAVVGEEWHLGEETYRSSVIRFAVEPQQLYNLARSEQASVIQLQSKAPYIGAAEQFEGHEDYWAEAGSGNRPYIPYNKVDGLGAPQRQQPPVASSGLMAEMQIAAEDIKRTTGIYDAGLGQRSNETSGVAIAQRKEESQNSTSIYADNMGKSVAHTGRILVDMIPRVYDTQRTVRILGEDGKEMMAVINGLLVRQDGELPLNDVTVGKYDVRISVGPSYSTKRQESVDGMMEFMRVFPDASPAIGDLVAKGQDWADAEKISERLAKMIPPELRETDKDAQAGPTPEQQAAMQAQQQAQDMAMQMQGLALEKEHAEVSQAKAKAAEAEAKAALAQHQTRLAMMAGQMPMQGQF